MIPFQVKYKQSIVPAQVWPMFSQEVDAQDCSAFGSHNSLSFYSGSQVPFHIQCAVYKNAAAILTTDAK